METLPPIVIIWCSISFENDDSHQSMKDDFNITTAAATRPRLNSIDLALLDDDRETFRLNASPLITVRTVDEAMRLIEQHNDKKIFVISSGTVGRYLVPEIIETYPSVIDFYILAHNIGLHVRWNEKYQCCVKMFDFPTDLLLRLTRDISSYFIKQGKIFLQVDSPQDALNCFNHARNLEVYANRRDSMESNINVPGEENPYFEFRDNLDLLEGEKGLIARAQAKASELNYFAESENME